MVAARTASVGAIAMVHSMPDEVAGAPSKGAFEDALSRLLSPSNCSEEKMPKDAKSGVSEAKTAQRSSNGPSVELMEELGIDRGSMAATGCLCRPGASSGKNMVLLPKKPMPASLLEQPAKSQEVKVDKASDKKNDVKHVLAEPGQIEVFSPSVGTPAAMGNLPTIAGLPRASAEDDTVKNASVNAKDSRTKTNAAAVVDSKAVQRSDDNAVEVNVPRSEVSPHAVEAEASTHLDTSMIAVQGEPGAFRADAVPVIMAAGGERNVTVQAAPESMAGNTQRNVLQTMDALPMNNTQPHRLLSATTRQIEIGVNDAQYGWLSIRAEAGSGGSVHASLMAPNETVQQSLRMELNAMSDYLGEQHLPLSGLSVHAFSERASSFASAHDENSKNPGKGAPNHNSERSDERERQRSQLMARPGYGTNNYPVMESSVIGRGQSNWINVRV